MAISLSQIIQNILLSINNALLKTDLSEDNRAALIEQFDRCVSMIDNNYEYSDVDLPVKAEEVINTLFSTEKSDFQTASRTLMTTLSDNANTLNSDLSTQIDTKKTELDTSISDFQTASQNLMTTLSDNANTLNSDLSTQVDTKKTELDTSISDFQTASQTLMTTLSDNANTLNSDLSTQVDTKKTDLIFLYEAKIAELEAWKNSYSKYNVSSFQGLYDPNMPGTATNFYELNELGIVWNNITRQNVNFSSINVVHTDIEDERFLAQVVRHQFGYHFFVSVGVIVRCEWTVITTSGSIRIDDQYGNKNFYGSQTWACWVRVPENSTSYNAINIVWQHPDAKNSDGSYNIHNWHLVGGHTNSIPTQVTISFPLSSSGLIELFGYSRVAGFVPIEEGVWFPIHQVGYKNSSQAVGGLVGQVS